MITKRFTYDKPLVAFSKGGINDNVTGETYEFTMDIVLDLLNKLHEENEELKYNLSAHMVDLNNYTGKCSALEIENEQLKQRNDRQAKRLAELYELMVKKDWESLTEIVDDFCSCEEQLQREWRTYK